MPGRPLRYCAMQGCPNKVRSGYCSAHWQVRERWRKTSSERGYDERWRRRARWFRERYPLCGMRPEGQAPVLSACHAAGRATPATCVDHVVPHRGNPTLFWDELGNWQSLCNDCHATKTARGL